MGSGLRVQKRQTAHEVSRRSEVNVKIVAARTNATATLLAPVLGSNLYVLSGAKTYICKHKHENHLETHKRAQASFQNINNG